MSRVDCSTNVEPCNVSGCSGLDLIVSLLPQGRLWDVSRESMSGRYFQALGEVFTQVNKVLCQEFNELNPCESDRLLPFWASIYCFPECVDLTSDNLCEWLTLIRDATCPIGSVGFYKAVIAWTVTKTGGCVDILLQVNQRGAFSSGWADDQPEADLNTLVVIAPPTCYVYDAIKDCYFIPEIECLRKWVFPIGVTLGYKTDPLGPLNEDIYGVPVENTGTKPDLYFDCEKDC